MDEDLKNMTHAACEGELTKCRNSIRLHKQDKNNAKLYAVLPEELPYKEPPKSSVFHDKRQDKV